MPSIAWNGLRDVVKSDGKTQPTRRRAFGSSVCVVFYCGRLDDHHCDDEWRETPYCG